MTDTERSKLRARRHHRGLRQAMSAQQRRAAAAGLADQVFAWLQKNDDGGSTVAAYLGVGHEPATDALLNRLAAAQHRVLLPVCEPQHQLAWVRWTPESELAPSTLAPVVEPIGRRETVQVMEEVGLVLVPALAVDTAGNRLGQGGGYYDRFLASMSEIQAVPHIAAVIFDYELLPANTFEHTGLDIAVDSVFTERRWHQAVRPAV